MNTVHHAGHVQPHPIATYFPAIGWQDESRDLDARAHDAPAQVIDKPWILCIDDDQEFSHGLKLRLQARGYDVIRAFAGMDGYQYAFEFEPRAILLDLHLPSVSGQEVLSQLRFHPSTAHIPVVVVTGLRKEGLQQQMIALGAADFFQKPVDFDRLMETVDRFSDGE